jgi:hypothetical protein
MQSPQKKHNVVPGAAYVFARDGQRIDSNSAACIMHSQA